MPKGWLLQLAEKLWSCLSCDLCIELSKNDGHLTVNTFLIIRHNQIYTAGWWVCFQSTYFSAQLQCKVVHTARKIKALCIFWQEEKLCKCCWYRVHVCFVEEKMPSFFLIRRVEFLHYFFTFFLHASISRGKPSTFKRSCSFFSQLNWWCKKTFSYVFSLFRYST